MTGPVPSHVDLTNSRGERVGRLVKLGLSWQAFTLDRASDTLAFIGTFSTKRDARDAIAAVATRAA